MDTRGLDEHRLSRLLEVGRALVSELDLEAVLDRLLEVARELTGARYAALGILDEHKTELERFITSGIDAETHAAIGDLPRGRGILGELIRNPRPLRLADLTEHARSYGFPPEHPPMRSFLGVPVLVRGEAYGNLYLTEKEGGEFRAEDEEALVVLADWAAIAIENARLYTGVDAQRSELERAVRGLEATTAIARAVGGETNLERVLELVVKRGRALVEARSLVILLAEEDELRVAASAGEQEAGDGELRVTVAGTLPGRVLNSGRAERVEAGGSDLRAALAGLAPEAEAAMLVPLAFRGRISGVLVALDRLVDGPAFDAEDERLMRSFAASAATAVATAQTVEADRLRHSIQAAERERGRWARELHDETLQGLGALAVLVTTALQSESAEHRERAAREAAEQIETEIEKLQGLITELRPAALDDIGLASAISSLAERTASTQGLSVDLNLQLADDGAQPEARFAPELESALYRLVQEALTNISKHARAESVRIHLSVDDGRAEVEIADDGCGFDPLTPKAGFGLLGMRERVELLGGRIEIASEPSCGTTIRAVLPTSL